MEEEKAVEEEKSLDESLAETFDEINKRDEARNTLVILIKIKKYRIIPNITKLIFFKFL